MPGQEGTSVGRPRGAVPWWLTAILCAVSFLVGCASSLASLPGGDCASSLKPSEVCPEAYRELNAEIKGLKEYIANQESSNNNGTSIDCPEPTPKAAYAGVVFDEAWVSDPNTVMKTINAMCRVVVGNKEASRKIGINTVFFCYTHTLVYRRAYDYSWESLDTVRGYYTGVDIPPYQMSELQYMSIIITIASIPSRPMLTQMEAKGAKFVDSANGSFYKAGRGKMGPRVLFWGCGADTPMHAHMMEYFGGNITFIDNSEVFMKQCKVHHPDIRLIQPTGDPGNMTRLVGALVPQDGSGMETDEIEDPLTASQWMSDLDGIENEAPWDVIVVDGPGMDLGRSQPLYMAKRLAQSYGPNHYTHIFLHDASRSTNCIISNSIMGHDPKTFIGNILPRKGLKHWRVPGRNRKLPPTKSRYVNSTLNNR